MQTAPHPVADPKTPDPELARRVADGDREAFKVMMKRHNQALFRTARAILKNDEEAEDSVQESWLLAHRSMGSFRGDAKLSTWLVRIAVNESLGRLRRSRRSAEVIPMSVDDTDVPMQENMPDESHAAAPEVQALRGEVRKLIESRIDKLPDAFRTVFVLRAVEEMSVEETAAALDIPQATVRTRFFRAKSLLRESLSREMDVAVEGAFSFLGERCDRIAAAVLARLG